MSKSAHFIHAIGLTTGVQRWLRNNEGVPLREEIISLFMSAQQNDFPLETTEKLRRLILSIKN